MNIKVQGGGGGAYANTGSSFGVVSYLRHEDADRAKNGEKVEDFFSHNQDRVTAKGVTTKIDSNKAKLSKSDSKFYVITVSPSKKEIQAMGKTPEEQAKNFKAYIKDEVMKDYATGFNKGLQNKDLTYFAKIHHERGAKGADGNMHAHIIVSRKDATNSIKLSPMTNHTGKKATGTAKGGFCRNDFYQNAEKNFDKKFDNKREYKESFEYCNTMKNGTAQEKLKAVEKSVQQEIELKNKVQEVSVQNQEQKSQERTRETKLIDTDFSNDNTVKRSRGMSR